MSDFIPLPDPAVSVGAIAYFKQLVFDPLEVSEKAWIAGGCLRSWLLEKKVAPNTDVDLWCTDDAERARLDVKAESAGWKRAKDTATSSNWRTKCGRWIQIIKAHHFPSPEETLEAFDFTVCALSLDAAGTFLTHRQTLLDLSMKRLILIRTPFPASTLMRAFKYREKGFRICAGELEKLVAAIRQSGEQPTNSPNYPWRGLD